MTTKHTLKRSESESLFQTSKTYFPGGVNSPVRAFKSVDGAPLFMKKGDGCHLWDEDGNKFIDFCCSWGPLILGHNHPKVFEKVVETLKNGSSFGAPTTPRQCPNSPLETCRTPPCKLRATSEH